MTDSHIKQNRIVQLATLAPHPRNYRVHPQAQIDKLVLSLQRFGQGRSIVVQDSPEHPIIVAGHGIVEAATALQWQELRADILPADWTDTQIEGYLIADNLHSQEASDNDELLAMLIQEQQDAGFDLRTIGTDDETLRQMLEAMGDGYLGHTAAEDDAVDEYENNSPRLHFESGRAGGCYHIYDHRTWDEPRTEQFRQWKKSPDTSVDETERMAQETSACIRSIFGGVLPPAILTIPPRGKTSDDKPYPCGIFAARVAALLGLDLVECVKRTEQDDAPRRARYLNLRDEGTYVLTRKVEALTIILDDVTTTGSTLGKMREVLSKNGIATVAIAYVVWHT